MIKSRTFTIALLIFALLSINFYSYSQEIYKITNYQLCNVNTLGVESNCKEFNGASLFEYFKIDPQFSIEFKYVNQLNTFNSRWDNNKIIQNDNDTYTYKMIDVYNSDKGTYFIVLLFFDNDTNELIRGFYSLIQNGTPITCKLYFDN